jgi:hypothetical protein
VEAELTQEDYREAIDIAESQGDAASLNELLSEFEKRWPDYGQTAPQKPQEPQPTAMDDLKGYVNRVGEFSMSPILEGGRERVDQRVETMTGGQHVAPRSEQLTEAAAGLSESIRRGGEVVMSGIALVTPDAVKEGLESAWAGVKDTPAMQTAANKVLDGFEAYKAWSTDNPKEAEAFETFVDLSAMIAPKPRMDLEGPADKARAASTTIDAGEKRKLIDKVMAPVTTREPGYDGKWVAQDDVLKTIKYEPHPREVAVRDALASVDELDPSANYVAIENVVERAISDQGEEVIAFINRAGNPKLNKKATRQYLESRFTDTSDAYGALNLTKEAQAKVAEYTELALKIIDESDYSVMGLYEARKRFDQVVNQFATKDILDPTVESAKGVAANHVRDVLNSVIKGATPGDKVAESFDRMHNLFRARDHLRMRSVGMADNSIKRAWSKIHDGLNLPSTPLALAATIGGAGTVAALVGLTPAAIMAGAGAGLSIYGVAKALSKPQRVKFYAMMLSSVDKGLKLYSGEKNLIRELKADRAVILSLLEEARAQDQSSQPEQPMSSGISGSS